MCAIPEHIGLTELVSVVWCLLLLGPCGMSAPTGKGKMYWWVEPCGGVPVESSSGEGRMSDSELLDTIMVTAQRALNKAYSFADDYTRETFSKKIKDIDSGLNSKSSPFTSKEVEKVLGEPTPLDHIERISQYSLDHNLLTNYRDLQRLAILLTQIVQKQKVRYEDNVGGKYYLAFESLRNLLKQVLCEVHGAITELGAVDKIVDQMPTENKMSHEDTDETTTGLHEFMVLRDYMLYMEYLVDCCQYFKKHPRP